MSPASCGSMTTDSAPIDEGPSPGSVARGAPTPALGFRPLRTRPLRCGRPGDGLQQSADVGGHGQLPFVGVPSDLGGEFGGHAGADPMPLSPSMVPHLAANKNGSSRFGKSTGAASGPGASRERGEDGALSR